MKPSDRHAPDGSHSRTTQAVESTSTGNVWVLIAAILGSSLAFIDGTVVNIALPAIQSGLHATSKDLQWVVEAYALSLASLLLVGGSFGDSYGGKWSSCSVRFYSQSDRRGARSLDLSKD